MKTTLVLVALLFAAAFAQGANQQRKNWDNDADYEGYEWMEPISHEGKPIWEDHSLYEEKFEPRFVEERFGPYGAFGVIEEYLQPEFVAPQWVSDSEPVEYTPDKNVGYHPPQKKVSPLWTPSPPKVKQALKPTYNTHVADSAGTQEIPAGTWAAKRF